MSESSESSRKRSRKAKLVPRECIEYDENNSTLQEPELAVQALLPKLRTGIDRDEEAFANTAPAPMEFSVNVEVEEFEEDVPYYEAENTSNDNTLSACIVPDHIIRQHILELRQQTTSLADKQLEIEILNDWGRTTKPIEETPFETIIQQAINKWRAWNSQSKFRETFLLYKCYVCEIGWWDLTPFRDHVKEHEGVNVNIEVRHHECNLIAYVKEDESVMRDIPIDGECSKCLKTLDEHFALKRKSNIYYFCEACNDNFFTCTALLEHEGICQKYHKKQLRSVVRHETDWKCNICEVRCLTKWRYDNHLLRRHSVRSDLVIGSVVPKACITCNAKYIMYNLHVCPKKTDNYQCKYCCRRFHSRYFTSLHEKMTKSGHVCRICNKYLKKQCMEMEHMVKHSRNYVLAYKCGLCEESILFPNEKSLRHHRVVFHGLKFDRRRGYLNMMIVPRKILNSNNMELMEPAPSGNFTIQHQPDVEADINKQSIEKHEIDEVIVDDIQKLQETEQELIDAADIKTEIEEADNAITCLLQETLKKRRESIDLGTDTFEYTDVKTEIQEIKTEKEDYEEFDKETDESHNNYEDIDIAIKKEQEEYIETLSKVFQASKSVENRKKSNASLLKQELMVKEKTPIPENRSLLRVQVLNKDTLNMLQKEKNLNHNMSTENNLLKELLKTNQRACTLANETHGPLPTVNEKQNSCRVVFEEETVGRLIELPVRPKVYVRNAKKPKVSNTSQLQQELLLAGEAFRTPDKTVSELIDPNFIQEGLTVKNIIQVSKHITGELISPTTLMRDHIIINKLFLPSQSNVELLMPPLTLIKDRNKAFPPPRSTMNKVFLPTKINAELQDVEAFINEEVEIKRELIDDDEYEDDIIVLNNSFDSTNSDNVEIKTEPRSSDITSETSVPEVEHMSNLEPDISIKIGRKKKKGINDIKIRKTYSCNKCAFKGPHKEYHEHKINVCPRRKNTNARFGRVYVSEKNLWRQYPCTKCNESFSTLRLYVDHFPTIHFLTSHACPQCSLVKLSTSALMAHIISHIKLSFVRIHMISSGKSCVSTRADGVYNCKECSETVRFRQFFSHWEAHMRLKVAKDEVDIPDEKARAPGSKKGSLTQDNLKTIIEQLTTPWDRIHRSNDLKSCSLCARAFARRNDVKRHIIEHLLIDAYSNKWRYQALQCQVCGAKHQKTDKYKQHMRQHGSLPLYKCELCNHAFSDSSNFAKHKKVHNLRCMVCDICKKKFNAKAQLERHIQLHEIIKPINCSECNKIYYSESAYKKHHRAAHEKDVKRFAFLCVICQQRFRCLREKWDHMWHVHKERKFNADCPFCDKSFRKFADVKSHVRDAHHIKLRRSKEDENVIMYEYGC